MWRFVLPCCSIGPVVVSFLLVMEERSTAESREESSFSVPRQAAEPHGLAPTHILSNTSPDQASHHTTQAVEHPCALLHSQADRELTTGSQQPRDDAAARVRPSLLTSIQRHAGVAANALQRTAARLSQPPPPPSFTPLGVEETSSLFR